MYVSAFLRRVDDRLQRYFGAVFRLRLVGSGHESVNLDCFLRGHRYVTRLEKRDYFFDQLLVTGISAARNDALRTVHERPVIMRSRAESAECADPAVIPQADNELRILSLNPSHRFASGSHDGEQYLDTMDTIPVEIGVMLLKRAGAECIAAEHIADLLVVPHADDARTEAER